MRRIAREGLIVGIGQIAVIVARFATVWWLTRVLDRTAFGEVALIQGVAALGFAFLCGPLLQAGLRFHPEASRAGQVPSLHGLMRPLVTNAAWLTAVVLLAGAAAWSLGRGAVHEIAAIAAGVAIVIPDAFRLYETNALNAARHQSAYTIWSVADAVARPIGAAAGIALGGPTSVAALTGTAAAVIIANAVCARALPREPKAVPEASWSVTTRRRIIAFAAPLVPLAIMAWVIGLADRYVLAATAGRAAAGLYSAAYGVGSQGFLALGIFGLTLFRPIYFAAVDHGDAPRARRIFLAWLATIGAVSALGVFLLAVFDDTIAALCLGPSFRSAAPLLAWIGAAYAFQAVQTALEVLIYAKRQTRRLLPVQISGAVTAIVLYAILIPRFGGFGAALATLGAWVVSCSAAAILGGLAATLRGSAAGPAGESPSEAAALDAGP